MDLRKLKTLIELVESSGIAELEISEGEERVRITRTAASAMQAYASVPQQTVIAAAPQAVATAAEPAKPAAVEGGGHQGHPRGERPAGGVWSALVCNRLAIPDWDR